MERVTFPCRFRVFWVKTIVTLTESTVYYATLAIPGNTIEYATAALYGLVPLAEATDQ